jgi:hypothetical protein
MNNLTQPAYPVVPLQDNFHRMIVPVPGLSKLEHFALEIFKSRLSNNIDDSSIELMNYSIDDAEEFLHKIEKKIKTLNNDKSNEMAIFDR